MLIAGDLLGLGHSTSSFGETFALGLTFIGVGIIANVLIAYAVFQVLAERRQNRERMDAYDRSQPREGR